MNICMNIVNLHEEGAAITSFPYRKQILSLYESVGNVHSKTQNQFFVFCLFFVFCSFEGGNVLIPTWAEKVPHVLCSVSGVDNPVPRPHALPAVEKRTCILLSALFFPRFSSNVSKNCPQSFQAEQLRSKEDTWQG